jgi:hypothetical protein
MRAVGDTSHGIGMSFILTVASTLHIFELYKSSVFCSAETVGALLPAHLQAINANVFRTNQRFIAQPCWQLFTNPSLGIEYKFFAAP